jgi:hypothetical protein
MNGYAITIITDWDHLSESDQAELLAGGVDTDDWNFMLIGPPELIEHESDDSDGDPIYGCVDTYIEGIIDFYSRYEGKWYPCKFRGKDCAIGVQYH